LCLDEFGGRVKKVHVQLEVSCGLGPVYMFCAHYDLERVRLLIGVVFEADCKMLRVQKASSNADLVGNWSKLRPTAWVSEPQGYAQNTR
jgi:hypothetical protein